MIAIIEESLSDGELTMRDLVASKDASPTLDLNSDSTDPC